MRQHALNEARIIRRIGCITLAVAEFVFNLVALDGDLLHLTLDDFLIELGEIGRRGRRPVRRALKHVEQGNEQKRDNDPEREIAKIVHGILS
jgi:hypothetical protein